MHRFARVAGVAISMLLVAACATQIKPSRETNPRPLEKFSAFSRFELKPIEVSEEYVDEDNHQRAAIRIQQHLTRRVQPVVEGWNRDGTRTLVIEPRIERIKVRPVEALVFAGPAAGSSAVLMKVRFTDKDTGKVIAEPEFYQHSAPMNGVATRNLNSAMLERVSTLVADYTKRNYSQRVGGDANGGFLPPDNEFVSM